MQRRQFIHNTLTSLLLGASPTLFAQTLTSELDEVSIKGWFSAVGNKPESYGFASDSIGPGQKRHSPQQTHGLSGFRGHGGAQHPVRKTSAILFGRRPNRESIEIDLISGAVLNRFSAKPNRHFFGHGAFSQDGKVLFTTEADLKRNMGVIGIRDADTYQWLGEYSTHGIGPHQILLMPNGRELAVANGGILTRPESGRKKLNLATMRSSLAYIDVHTGALNSEWTVTEPKASIRHIDVSTDGTVALAMQVQRSACRHENLVPLAALHTSDKPIQLLKEPGFLIEQMTDYIGSVAINSKARTAGFTSPRGDVVGFWNIDHGEFLGYHAMRDVCGIAAPTGQSNFILTNSYGLVQTLNAQTLTEQKQLRHYYDNLNWDNHMISIS